MAQELASIPIDGGSVSVEERTFRLEIISPKNQTPSVNISRENSVVLNDVPARLGNSWGHGVSLTPEWLALPVVIDDATAKAVGVPTNLTVGQIAAMIPYACDAIIARIKDLKAAAAKQTPIQ